MQRLDDRLVNGLWLEAMRKKGQAELVLRGSSMEPVIPKGSRIRIDTDTEPQAGSVSCFLQGENFFVHRVLMRLKIGNLKLFLEGPETFLNPGHFVYSDYLGRVSAYRFPDSDEQSWHSVQNRAVSFRERIAASRYLLKLPLYELARLLKNRVFTK